MKKLLSLSFLVAASLWLLPIHPSSAAGLESLYTDLSGKNCKIKVSKDIEGESSSGTCPGVGGYKLQTLEGDLRSSVTVVDPKGKEFPLDLWSVISGHFSSLGDKAEWLVERTGNLVTPKALIVRLNAAEDVDHPNKLTSYLSVSKITPTSICVTDKIQPGPQMNDQARQAAQNAAGKPCLGSK